VVQANPFTWVPPRVEIYLPQQSQFRAKTEAHENKHVEQWGPRGMNADLYQPATYWNNIMGFTASTEDELIRMIALSLTAQDLLWANAHDSRRDAMEVEAWAAGDAVAPYYFAGYCYGY
jgi:hypothetical protein